MNSYIKACLTTLVLVLLCSALSFALPIDGELGITARGYDEDEITLYRLREFQSLPNDGSVSTLRIVDLFPGDTALLWINGFNLGEDDAAGDLYVGLNDLATFAAGYGKTQHLLDLENNFFTERIIEKYALNVFPLSDFGVAVKYSIEDKAGRIATPTYVNQENEVSEVDVRGRIGGLVVTAGLSDEEFSENDYAHETDGAEAAVNWTPGDYYFGAAWAKKDIDPAMTNPNSTIELTRTDLVSSLLFAHNLSLTTLYSSLKRSNLADGAISYDADTIYTALNISSRFGKAVISYKNVQKDFANADIDSLDTETFAIKGSSKISFLGVKAGYIHSDRDASGVSDNLINFSEQNAESTKQNMEVYLIGFKKFWMSVYGNRTSNKYTPSAIYGTTVSQSRVVGVSSSYAANENFMLTLNIFENQDRMESRQRFWRTDDVSGLNTIIDTTFQIADDTDYFQATAYYNYSSATDITLDFTASSSNLKDPQRDNRVKERILTLSIDKELTHSYSLNTTFTISSYDDMLDPTFSKGNGMVEMELTRKF